MEKDADMNKHGKKQIKQGTNKDLMYNIGNYIQYLVISHM